VAAIARPELACLVAKVEAVGPKSFHMDLHLLENRFEFQRALPPRTRLRRRPDAVTDAVQNLVAALAAGQVEVVDLTQPLSEETPILPLPEPFANTPSSGSGSCRATTSAAPPGTGTPWRGASTPAPTWTPPSTGSPAGPGRRQPDPPARLIGPALVIDHADRATADPDHLLGSRTWRRSRPSTGRCPRAAGCCTAPAGTPAPRTRPPSSTPTTRAPHPRDRGGLRPLAGRPSGPSSARGRDRRHRRRRRPQLRPARSPATASCSGGQVRPHPAGQRRPPPATGALLIAAPLKIVGGSAARPGSWPWSRADPAHSRSPWSGARTGRWCRPPGWLSTRHQPSAMVARSDMLVRPRWPRRGVA
jgi:hypothetical protein